MYIITEQIYKELAAELCERIVLKDYFSGEVMVEAEDVECRLLLSLILYRAEDEIDGAKVKILADIVPVWWEVHLLVDGQEMICDFDFQTFKSYLL
ncbi:MAG: hypothetical protein SNH88_03875 [Rikenellaceae bacterium]